MQPFVNILYFFAVIVALGAVVTNGEPEPMARPTRPKVFTSPEELRRYLDLVKDYYSLSGKARYGKRGDVSFSAPELNRPWDALRMILEMRRQMQQQREEQDRHAKERILQDLSNVDDRKRLEARPTYLSDIVEKYYDDLQ